jgi:hypothetical protein
LHDSYQLYVHDTRYSVPTLVFVPAGSKAQAQARAEELLQDSEFHIRVDVERAGRRLVTIERTATAA